MSKLFGSKHLFYTVVASVLIALFALSTTPTIGHAQNQKPLLGTQMTNVNATSNVMLNATLPSGFTLSGAVRGADPTPIFGGTVIARSGNQTFTGNITFRAGASTYQVTLAPGTYSLTVNRLALDTSSGTAFFVTSDAGMVTVMANTTRDLMLPATPATVPISGNVASLGTLPTEGSISFYSTDGKIQASAQLKGSYSARLPRGTYDVVISLGIMQGGLNQSLSLRMGMVAVNGPQNFNFTLPMTWTLSGTVKNNDGSPAPSSSVFTIDTNDLGNLPGGSGNPCGGSVANFIATSGFVAVPKDSTTGAYRLLLPPRTYSMGVSIDLDPSDNVAAILSIPVPSLELNLSTDRTQNFMFPAIPPFFNITGKVTDMNGQPVGKALVTAFTSMITNTPNAAFSTSVEAASDGTYQLKVLSGTNYTVVFCPPVSASTKMQPANKLNEAVQTILRFK
jgi:hypothetical protein